MSSVKVLILSALLAVAQALEVFFGWCWIKAGKRTDQLEDKLLGAN